MKVHVRHWLALNHKRAPRDLDCDADGVGLRRLRRLWVGVHGLIVVGIMGGAIAGALWGRPRPGHDRNVAGLIIAVSVVVVIMVLSGALGWRFLAHRGSARQLMRADWRTRRRVGIALKKGRPIQPADRGTAQATIDYHRSHGWVCWIWLGVGLVWLMNTALAHGNRRWFDLALATFYFAFIPYWVRLRKKILSRETEIVMPDPPQNPVATAPIQT